MENELAGAIPPVQPAVRPPIEEKQKIAQLVNKKSDLRVVAHTTIASLISGFFRDPETGRIFFMHEQGSGARKIHVVRSDGKVSQRLKHDFNPAPGHTIHLIDSLDIGISDLVWTKH